MSAAELRIAAESRKSFNPFIHTTLLLAPRSLSISVTMQWLGSLLQWPDQRADGYQSDQGDESDDGIRTVPATIVRQPGPDVEFREVLTVSIPPAPSAPSAPAAPALECRINKLDLEDRCAFNVSVQPLQDRRALGVRLVCCIDVSRSMEEAVPLHNPDTPRGYLQVLDLVKHAVRTVITSLRPQDEVALVSFSTNARVVAPFTPTTDAGKGQLISAVNGLEVDASTNMWAGIAESFKLLQDARQRTPRGTVVERTFFFTDGVPSYGCTDVMGPLEKFDRERGIPGSLYTFGFGNKLDSGLLSALASRARGLFHYISDGQLLGSIFTAALANLLTACATEVTMTIHTRTPDDIVLHLPTGSCSAQEDKVTARLPDMRIGQNADIVFTTRPGTEVVVEISYYSGDIEPVCLYLMDVDSAPTNRVVLEHVLRTESAEHFVKLSQMAEFAQEHYWKPHDLDAFIGRVRAALPCLAQDWDVQVRQAATSYTSTWGPHFLRSLAFAHWFQACTNFKDPGVQKYAGDVFRRVRDDVNVTFNTVDVPVIRIPDSVKRAAEAQGRPIPTPPRLNVERALNSRANPCFAEGCTIKTAKRGKICIEDLCAGDEVVTLKGVSRVTCILKTIVTGCGQAFCVSETGLRITPYHPILEGDEWVFPQSLYKVQEIPSVKAIYSVLLENGGEVCVNETWALTLAHGNDAGSAYHPYFGTPKVVEDMKKHEDFESGYITVQGPLEIERDVDERVCSMHF